MIDYEATYRAHRLEVPEHFNFGRDVVDALADLESSGYRCCLADFAKLYFQR